MNKAKRTARAKDKKKAINVKRNNSKKESKGMAKPMSIMEMMRMKKPKAKS